MDFSISRMCHQHFALVSSDSTEAISLGSHLQRRYRFRIYISSSPSFTFDSFRCSSLKSVLFRLLKIALDRISSVMLCFLVRSIEVFKADSFFLHWPDFQHQRFHDLHSLVRSPFVANHCTFKEWASWNAYWDSESRLNREGEESELHGLMMLKGMNRNGDENAEVGFVF